MTDRESVLGGLGEDPNESQFCNRASGQLNGTVQPNSAHPQCESLMEFVLKDSQRHQGVYVEEILHGNSAKSSRTSLLVSSGAFGPAERTDSPVMGSFRIATFFERDLLGVNTMRRPSTLASRGSPGRRPSWRRIGPGSTTCPLVESFVCMVRRSYLGCRR